MFLDIKYMIQFHTKSTCSMQKLKVNSQKEASNKDTWTMPFCLGLIPTVKFYTRYESTCNHHWSTWACEFHGHQKPESIMPF